MALTGALEKPSTATKLTKADARPDQLPSQTLVNTGQMKLFSLASEERNEIRLRDETWLAPSRILAVGHDSANGIGSKSAAASQVNGESNTQIANALAPHIVLM